MLVDIFVVRALDLDGRFGPGDAASYLSGLQIGHELCEAMARFGSELGRPVQLVCAPNLARLYDRAFARYRLTAVGLSGDDAARSEEHTSELQSLMRISYAVFCLKKKKTDLKKKQRVNIHHEQT